MPALTAKESARYGVRLFGYLLTSTLFGGAFVGAGAGLAYTLEPAFFDQLFGTAGTDLTALAAFGTLSAVGVLVVLTGFFLVGFVAATDAVRIGTNRSALSGSVASRDASADETTPDSAGPADAESTSGASVPAVPPGRGAGDGGEADPDSAASPVPDRPGGVRAEANDGGEEYDPSDPIGDPHEAQTDPFGESHEDPATVEEWTSKPPADHDEAWREEIEAKLEGEDAPDSS